MNYEEWNCLEPVDNISLPRDLFRSVYLLGEVWDAESEDKVLVVLVGMLVNAESTEAPAYIIFRFSPADRLAYDIDCEVIAAPLRFIRWAGVPVDKRKRSFDDDGGL